MESENKELLRLFNQRGQQLADYRTLVGELEAKIARLQSLVALEQELLAALKECVYVIDPKGGRMERYALKVAGAAITKAEGA